MTERPGATDSEVGYTLLEVTVALTILLGMATAVLAILSLAAQTSATDRKRVAAANLAAREIEIVRNAFHSGVTPNEKAASANAVAAASNVTNGNSLPGQPAGALTVDGTSYTVVREVSWLPLGTGKSACDGGSAVTHPGLAVHVSVTWPSMGRVKPVVSDTVLTPPKGVLNSAVAFAAVRIRDRGGAPYEGRSVRMTGPAGTFTDITGPDGCAVFALSAAGSYNATLTEAGFVAPDGNPTPQQAKSITAGTVQTWEFSYDRSAGLNRVLAVSGASPDVGSYALPATLPGLTIGNSHLQPDGVRTFTSGTAATPALFPWPEGYTAWAGTCSDADPASEPSSGTRTATGARTPGQVDTVTLTLRPVKVVASNPAVLALTTLPRVQARSLAAGGCPGGDGQVELGRLGVDEMGTWLLRASLPPGGWQLTVVDETGAAVGTPQNVTLTNDGGEVAFT
ncbi:MAG: hypothetical protein JWM62_360 [Frankiales bacterium]|nr:hypothetical protein [Frankiales bacterium]